MKRISIILLIMSLTISMVSCGRSKEEENDSNIVVNIDNGKEEKPPIEIQDANENNSEAENQIVDNQVNIESNNMTNENKEETEETSEDKQSVENTESESVENAESESEEVSRKYRLFFYDGVDDTICHKDTELEVIDKAVTKALTNGLKSSPGGNFLTMPSNVEVLSAKLDGDSITVNLSDSYYDFSSSLGSAAEIGMLESLALTYSYNYNVSNVRILVNGQNYTSGHLSYEENDYIRIDHIETKEL